MFSRTRPIFSPLVDRLIPPLAPNHGSERLMHQSCPYCGISVDSELRCPLCDSSLVRVDLRRTLLWAFVAGEYLVMVVLMLRLG